MRLEQYPSLDEIVSATIRIWPAHVGFLSKRFADCRPPELEFANRLAEMILRCHDRGLEDLIAGYKWTCGAFMLEEAHFRKTGAYRHTSFAAVAAAVYHDRDYMQKYLSGLLLSQVLWSNHCRSMDFYRSQFLASLPDGAAIAEIGPGHGFLLALAATEMRFGALNGYDISAESVEQTRMVIDRLGLAGVQVHCRSFDTEETIAEGLDALIVSEVLEHLEDPVDCLRRWTKHLRPETAVYINVPTNSPAPDHIYLLRDYHECLALAEAGGLSVQTMALFPATGMTLKKAHDMKSTISCCIIGRRY